MRAVRPEVRLCGARPLRPRATVRARAKTATPTQPQTQPKPREPEELRVERTGAIMDELEPDRSEPRALIVPKPYKSATDESKLEPDPGGMQRVDRMHLMCGGIQMHLNATHVECNAL